MLGVCNEDLLMKLFGGNFAKELFCVFMREWDCAVKAGLMVSPEI